MDTRTAVAPVQPTLKRRWIFADASRERTQELAQAAKVSPLLAHLLVLRGVEEAESARSFLEPALAHLHDPSLLPDMDKAVERLHDAIEKKEPILLYADYDVDGISGASILTDILEKLGATVQAHIPDRVKDGYGLKVERLKRARDEGVKVVVSIDNGVTAVAEAEFCREAGIDLIVTDHHTMKKDLPRPLALVHPRVPGSRYPNPDICGAGVAFKLAWGISARRGVVSANGVKKPAPAMRDRLLAALALVALGTVADVVSLKGENRALVRFGLRALELGPTPGLRALLDVCSAWDGPSPKRAGLDATTVAFQLAPRINAAGRMGEARRAFSLLTATNDADARRVAAELDRDNARRRGVQKETTESARAEVERVYAGVAQLPGAIVIAGEKWPLGVVGIVAAKIVEEFRRPSLVLTFEPGGELAKGSGRSLPGFDLLRCLEQTAELYGFQPGETWGGHAAACGIAIKRERVDAFRAAWSAAAAATAMRGNVLATEAAPPEAREQIDGAARIGAPTEEFVPLVIDAEVGLHEVDHDLVSEIARLEPFGQGNRPPILAARRVELAGQPQLMGRSGEHCAFFVRQGDAVLRSVAFSRPNLVHELRQRATGPKPPSFELAFRPKLNHWNGRVSVELEVEDVLFPT